MDRDEAIAKGVKVNDTRHSMKRRCPWHDYHGKGTYMLTLVVEGRMPLLGRLAGLVDAYSWGADVEEDYHIPADKEIAYGFTIE